jgi:hypothetical protein
MGGVCSTNVEKRNAYRLLAGKPEGKGPLGRTRRRSVDNIHFFNSFISNQNYSDSIS